MWGPDSPARSYLVCGNQRSGTTLLCGALKRTGCAGQPDEYFLAAEPSLPMSYWEEGPFAPTSGARTREAYLDHVYQLGTTPNGVFGAKVMWNNVAWMLQKFREMRRYAGMAPLDILRDAFPVLRVVKVVRRDRVRQAVSWARAAQTNVFWQRQDLPAPEPTAEPRFDYGFLSALYGLIRRGEQGWDWLCSALGVNAITVVYEDFTASQQAYATTVRTVLDYLGVLSDPKLEIPPPRLVRQADALNDRWTEAFVRERQRRWDAFTAESQVVCGYLEQVWNERRYEAAADFLDRGCSVGTVTGPDAAADSAASMHRAFPDLRLQIDAVIGQGSQVGTWATLHGSQFGAFLGHPPEARPATWHQAGLWDVRNGKILQGALLTDTYGLHQQLGIIPPDGA